MNKKFFFRDYVWAVCIFYLIWIDQQNKNFYVVNVIKAIGILPITILLFILGIIIDYFLNREESFLKTKISPFNTVIFITVILIAFLIRFRLI